MLEVEHITKSYGKKEVLKDITFSVSSGEQVAIIGRNGCGKTTLMQIMTGMMRADGGDVKFYHKSAFENRKLFSKYCGYVPQENPLMEELSVKDNLSLWTGTRQLPDRKLMEMFQLDEILKTPVSKLSGGMKRRVSIACAVANWPPILFMDEPTTALDIYYRESIHEWMKEYRKMNGILILATHDREEIDASTRCANMENGKITFQ